MQENTNVSHLILIPALDLQADRAVKRILLAEAEATKTKGLKVRHAIPL